MLCLPSGDPAVGFEDSNASTTAAVLLKIVQDSIGRVATILFAHRLGSSLEPECKRFRFAADIFNDSALIVDCLSPVFPKPLRVVLLSTAGTLRALCGVAGGGMSRPNSLLLIFFLNFSKRRRSYGLPARFFDINFYVFLF